MIFQWVEGIMKSLGKEFFEQKRQTIDLLGVKSELSAISKFEWSKKQDLNGSKKNIEKKEVIINKSSK
jgi:hypothetical protein